MQKKNTDQEEFIDSLRNENASLLKQLEISEELNKSGNKSNEEFIDKIKLEVIWRKSD